MEPDEYTLEWIRQEIREAADGFDEYESWTNYWREAVPRPLNRFGADEPAELPMDLADWVKGI
jgi:hypothetical protein